MKYWNTYEQLDFETYSTNYLQVAWGKPDECKYWDKDSLFLEGDLFDSLDGMMVLIRSGALPTFDFYYDTVVYSEDWKRMRHILMDMGGEYAIFISELADWVGNGFDNGHKCFTILGV